LKLFSVQAKAPQAAHHAEKAARARIDGEALGKICLKRRISADMSKAPFMGLEFRGDWGWKISPDYIIGVFLKISMLFLDFFARNHYNKRK
jgi:hypothetical protein